MRSNGSYHLGPLREPHATRDSLGIERWQLKEAIHRIKASQDLGPADQVIIYEDGEVTAGERITITRHGTPIARLVPVKPSSPRQIRETIAKLKQFSKGQTLGGLKVKDLIARAAGERLRHRRVRCPRLVL